MGLSTKEMEEVGELVNDSIYYGLDSFQNSQGQLIQFLYSMRTKMNLTVLLNGSAPSVKLLNDTVFGDKTIASFFQIVTTHFFAKFGDTKTRYPLLVDNLAEAIGFIKPVEAEKKKSITLVTDDYLADVAGIDDVRDLMLENRWVTTVALVILYLMPMDGFQEIMQLKKEADAKKAAAEARQQRLEAQEKSQA